MTIVVPLPPLLHHLEKQLAILKTNLQLMTTVHLLSQRVLEVVEYTTTTIHLPEILPPETLLQEIRLLEILHQDREIAETEATEILVTQSLQDLNHANTTTTTTKTILQSRVDVDLEETIL